MQGQLKTVKLGRGGGENGNCNGNCIYREGREGH